MSGQSLDFLNLTPVAGAYVAGSTINMINNNGNIPVSAGLISLTARKTYKIDAYIQGTNGGWLLELRDTSNSTIRVGNTLIEDAAANISKYMSFVYTPSSNIQVKFVQITAGSENISGTNGYVNITQIGSSAITTTNRVNVICRGKTIPTSLITTAWTKQINYIAVQDPTSSMNVTTGLFTAPRTTTYAFTAGCRIPTFLANQSAGISVWRNGTTQFYNTWISS